MLTLVILSLYKESHATSTIQYEVKILNISDETFKLIVPLPDFADNETFHYNAIEKEFNNTYNFLDVNLIETDYGTGLEIQTNEHNFGDISTIDLIYFEDCASIVSSLTMSSPNLTELATEHYFYSDCWLYSNSTGVSVYVGTNFHYTYYKNEPGGLFSTSERIVESIDTYLAILPITKEGWDQYLVAITADTYNYGNFP